MNLTERGEDLVARLKTHLLEVLRSRPECQLGDAGLSNAAIERYAGLALHLEKQDHWLCWSILKVLQREGKAEAVGSPTRWRLRERARE
jgi:hypothetical protein